MGKLGALFADITKGKKRDGGKAAKLAAQTKANKKGRADVITAKRTGKTVQDVKSGNKNKKETKGGLKKGAASQLGKAKAKSGKKGKKVRVGSSYGEKEMGPSTQIESQGQESVKGQA